MKSSNIFKILYLIIAIAITYLLYIISQGLVIKSNMSVTEASWFTIKDIISLLALLLSPIIAVLVGQNLQNKKTKRDRIYNNKFSIFATILGYRHSKGFSDEFIIVINQIPIVFNKNGAVLEKLKSYIKNHRDTVMDDETANRVLNSDLNDLVIEIAKDLKFKNVDNYVMTNYFYPKVAEFRDNRETVYNEIYLLENSQRLNELRLAYEQSLKQVPHQ